MTKRDLVEEARQLRLKAEAFEKKVAAQIARGTQRDVKRPKTPSHGVVVKPAIGPYYVGDEGPTEELMTMVQLALKERPMRFAELLEATGARDNRIKGVIMRLQREGVNVVDIAPEGSPKAIWFIPNDELLARLTRARRNATSKR